MTDEEEGRERVTLWTKYEFDCPACEMTVLVESADGPVECDACGTEFDVESVR